MNLAIMAFVRAQERWSPFSDETQEVVNYIAENPFSDFEFVIHGVSIKCNVNYSDENYIASDLHLMFGSDKNSKYSFELLMDKID